ncbi:MAG: TonB-dependent receptor [Bacteroidota bacterium]
MKRLYHLKMVNCFLLLTKPFLLSNPITSKLPSLLLQKHSIKILVIILLVSACSILNAQSNSSLKGVVVDAVTGEALPGANVIIVGTALGCAADLYGNYYIKNLPPGDMTVRVSYVGYKTIEQSVRTFENKTTEINFSLEFESIVGEVIVITAQAKGQTEAINQQLSANAIVNIVSSARIQEIPDANAAESVGRLPGVSILRSGGEGNKVVIRGLAPKYNNIQVAGIKMASTETRDRSVDLSMISPYMLEGIEVIKAITPDMDADAIGGTVNFKLKEAPKGFKHDFILQGGYNDLKNKYNDYKIVGSGSSRFFDNQLGVFGQIDIEQRNRSSNVMSSGYRLNSPELDKVNPVYINSLGLSDVSRIKKRYGGTVVLDYELPTGSIILNNFFSLSNTDAQSRNESYEIEPNTHTYSTSYSERELNVMVSSLNYTQDFPFFKVEAEISHSYSTQRSPDYVSFTFQEARAMKNVNLKTSPYNLPKYAIDSIPNTFLTDVFRSNELSQDRELVGSLNLSGNFSLLEKLSAVLKIGGKFSYKDRNYDYEAKGGFFNFGSGQDARDAILNAFPWMKKTVPSGSINMPYSLFIDYNHKSGTFLKGKYSLGPSANIGLMRGVIEVLEGLGGKSEAYRYYDFSSNTNDYSGNEYYNAGFTMADFQFSNFLKVIAGARYEEVKRVYTAVGGNSSEGLPQVRYMHLDTTTTVKHSNWLPMVHVKFKPLDWFDVRFAYTNTLSRPDFTTITPRYNIGTEAVTWNNYKLKPAHSENLDLYFSFHANALGLFTIGGFKKYIRDMIFASFGKVLLDPSTIGMPPEVKGRTLYTFLNNEHPVKLWGIELSWQTNFWYLPGFLKGLVLDVNYTHINSEAKYPRTIIKSSFVPRPPWILQTEIDTFYTARMVTQPNDIVNISLGYDYKGFSIRGSILYQSNIFIATNFWPELRENTDDFLRWDLSVKQELPWDGFQLFVNVTNISGAMDRDINAGNKFPSSEQYYGTGVDVGIRYRLK